MTELTIKVSGEAGLGVQTIGEVLCRIFKAAGLYLFSIQDYMSRVRGGNNFIQVRVASEPVFSCRERAHITVALDRPGVLLHQARMETGGVLVLDRSHLGFSGENSAWFDAPLYAIAENAGKSARYVNSAACGVIAGMVRLPFAPVKRVLERAFAKKGAAVVEANIAAAKEGHGYAMGNFHLPALALEPAPERPDLLLNGNEALALGAIQAGCKFFSAYPMSPSTGVMETMAHYADNAGIIVEQAEDEIAAVNMVIGASFAGVRAMTATSGGGFALMAEGLSLAAMTETPIVMVDAQRPGPATGFPTRTEQADLNFLIHAGHGEFARVIYSPGTAEEAFFLAQKAFEVAEKYQVPVMIMTDQTLADSVRNVSAESLDFIKINRHLVSKEESGSASSYKRYQLTPSGISPRAVPSRIADVIYADSDEHTEEGHITEDGAMRTRMVEKRLSLKLSLLRKEIVPPEAYRTENAKVLLVGFGSTYGAILDAVNRLENPGIGFIHLPQVWPFPAEAFTALAGKKARVITVENNAGAQLAGLIRRETGVAPEASILKFDGRPFDVDFLEREIKKAAK